MKICMHCVKPTKQMQQLWPMIYVVELKNECCRISKGPHVAPKDVILHFKPSDKMVTMHMILSRALCAVYPVKTIEMETRDFGVFWHQRPDLKWNKK